MKHSEPCPQSTRANRPEYSYSHFCESSAYRFPSLHSREGAPSSLQREPHRGPGSCPDSQVSGSQPQVTGSGVTGWGRIV